MTSEAADAIEDAPPSARNSGEEERSFQTSSPAEVQRVFRTDWKASNGNSAFLAMVANRDGKALILDAPQIPLTPELAREISRELTRYADAAEA